MIGRTAPLIVTATFFFLVVASDAHAQWVTQWHAPVVVAPQPMIITNQPVVRVHRAPMVVYHPRRVYARHRPILGGAVVHTRPARHRVMW